MRPFRYGSKHGTRRRGRRRRQAVTPGGQGCPRHRDDLVRVGAKQKRRDSACLTGASFRRSAPADTKKVLRVVGWQIRRCPSRALRWAPLRSCPGFHVHLPKKRRAGQSQRLVVWSQASRGALAETDQERHYLAPIRGSMDTIAPRGEDLKLFCHTTGTFCSQQPKHPKRKALPVSVSLYTPLFTCMASMGIPGWLSDLISASAPMNSLASVADRNPGGRYVDAISFSKPSCTRRKRY